MKLLHAIGNKRISPNFNTPEEIERCDEPMSFDGVYKSVYKHRKLLKDKDVTLFIMGDYVGGDNAFDEGQPFMELCNWKELFELRDKYGCKLGWHSWSHKDLTTLDEKEIKFEIEAEYDMDTFAYPYGRFNEKVIEVVKDCGYKSAYTVYQGDGSDYQKNRDYL